MISEPGGDGSDRELLAAHVAGDTEAFSRLVHRHRDRLWSLALRTTSNPDDAADALQEALLSASRAAGSYRGTAQVTTWLHRIVVNACLDGARRRAARPTVTLHQVPDLVDRHDLLAERDLAAEVRAALADLPREQRVAVVLVHLQGWSVADAALLLEVPVGTVKSRCSRGRARLAVSLGHLRNPNGPEPVPPVADRPGPTTRSEGQP